MYTKTELERALEALAIRPLLWNELTPLGVIILWYRMQGWAAAAIAANAELPGPVLQTEDVQKYEQAACRVVLKMEKLHANFDRHGLGARYANDITR